MTCEGYEGVWCEDFDHHTRSHEFCENHQVCWCRVCDGRCPECRSWRALGEPDEDEDDDLDPF